MPDRASQGFCYVVNTPGYLAEALLSIASLKRCMPAAQVCVVAPEALWRVHPGVDEWRALTLGDRTPIVKNDATLAPYARVAFIDSDTRFLRDMTDVFDLLEAFDLAAAHEPLRGWNYATPAPHAFCELNTGVLVFRNSPKIRGLFDRWLAEYRRLLAERGFRNDQIAFRNAVWGSPEIRLTVLPPEYHCITTTPVALAWDARLLHDRRNIDFAAAQINRELGPRSYVPGIGLVLPFQGRRGWLRGWLRASWHWLRVLLHPGRLEAPVDLPRPNQWSTEPAGEGTAPGAGSRPV